MKPEKIIAGLDKLILDFEEGWISNPNHGGNICRRRGETFLRKLREHLNKEKSTNQTKT